MLGVVHHSPSDYFSELTQCSQLLVKVDDVRINSQISSYHTSFHYWPVHDGLCTHNSVQPGPQRKDPEVRFSASILKKERKLLTYEQN